MNPEDSVSFNIDGNDIVIWDLIRCGEKFTYKFTVTKLTSTELDFNFFKEHRLTEQNDTIAIYRLFGTVKTFKSNFP